LESNAALNSKISALEDEMRIIKGEVKQVLTEIRSAILVQDSPFEDASTRAPRPIQVVPAVVDEPARVEIVMQRPEQQHVAVEATPAPAPHHTDPASAFHQSAQEHAPASGAVHAAQNQQASVAHAARPAPRWNLLTVASLAAWAEESLQRLGPQRLAILLDLCEVSGYLPPEARQALGRVTELDVPAPEKPATAMEITLLLRQLDALIQGEANDIGLRLL
jgi:signal transduction histidine kinase